MDEAFPRRTKPTMREPRLPALWQAWLAATVMATGSKAMAVWHVAIEELRDVILAEGLDPAGERAVLLLAEMPEQAEGFDVWEVDAEGTGPVGDAAFLRERIAPERLRLFRQDPSPGM